LLHLQLKLLHGQQHLLLLQLEGSGKLGHVEILNGFRGLHLSFWWHGDR
jgi:hypothetical protein